MVVAAFMPGLIGVVVAACKVIKGSSSVVGDGFVGLQLREQQGSADTGLVVLLVCRHHCFAACRPAVQCCVTRVC